MRHIGYWNLNDKAKFILLASNHAVARSADEDRLVRNSLLTAKFIFIHLYFAHPAISVG